MAKIYSTLLFLVITTTVVSAQITLTSAANSPQIGDSFDYIITPNYAFNVSQTGANQTWDFSSATGVTEVVDFIDLSSSLEPLTFPLANLVSVSTNGESYLSSSTSKIAIVGIYSPGVARAIYPDNQEYIKYPITYNDVFNETFSGTLENIAAGQTFDRSGTIEISADGYGDLILPYTTVNNVLRIKIINNSSDLFMGIPVGTYNETIFLWYNATTNTHIASTTDAFANGMLLLSQATYLSQSDLVLAINDVNIVDSQISIYPTPANNYVNIKNTSGNALPINIYDIRGAFIKTINIDNGKTQINISDLHSGIYLLNYTKESQRFTKKLVVE